MLEEAQQRIRDAGHPLQITSDNDANAADEDVAFAYACQALYWHFDAIPPSDLVTMVRQFPLHMAADVQVAVDRLFASPLGFFGVREEYRN